MTHPKSLAEVSARIEVAPKRSQTFLVASAVVAAIALICGTSLFESGHASGWGFLILAIAILYYAFKAWGQSQSDTDLHQGHPTKLTLQNGISVSTDSRILKSPEGLRGLTNLIQEALSRQPLPEPDGLLDKDTNLIPNSANEAIKQINKINAEVLATTNSLIDILQLSDNNPDAANLNVIQHDFGPNNAPNQAVDQNMNIARSKS